MQQEGTFLAGYGGSPSKQPSPPHPSVTVRSFLRQTGLGIKFRFLIALTLIALFPALFLVLLLGDPSGQEQLDTLGWALSLQSQTQALTFSQTVAARQTAVETFAGSTVLAQLMVETTPGTSAGQPNGLEALHAAQQTDPASLLWLVCRSTGVVMGSSTMRGIGQPLATMTGVGHLDQLSSLLHVSGTTPQSLLAFDENMQSSWLALAAPLARDPGRPKGVLIALFSLPKLFQPLVPISNMLDKEALLVLDSQGHMLLSSGIAVSKQQGFVLVPPALQTLVPGQSSLIQHNALTGRTDLAVASLIPSLEGRLLLLAPKETSLMPTNRTLVAGRNTPLLILSLLVAVALLAPLLALPIIRPIRRATRAIGVTTLEVRELATDAKQIAQEHEVGTRILSGANQRLLGRRQSIIRDSSLIVSMCQALWPRVDYLRQLTPQIQDKTYRELVPVLQRGISEIGRHAQAIGTGLQNDSTLDQLSQAMESAREISTEFVRAGEQLEDGAEQLEVASRALL